ncbi:hypothetical protein CgunFtcFv8_007758 [Champsocephalus gunnari]|uniref:Uncharacterized protein n=1 Tax=Champsocephalus gunnari TaxID=52237 RepID=A0AAN8CHQ5_CHAGU|nr:hypothetical protein CgunFtcFv8_007758 [Champsocephalus gunnari]
MLMAERMADLWYTIRHTTTFPSKGQQQDGRHDQAEEHLQREAHALQALRGSRCGCERGGGGAGAHGDVLHRRALRELQQPRNQAAETGNVPGLWGGSSSGVNHSSPGGAGITAELTLNTGPRLQILPAQRRGSSWLPDPEIGENVVNQKGECEPDYRSILPINIPLEAGMTATMTL